MEFKHVPIMLKECITGLNIKKDGVYVDATLGGGGHSAEIIKHLNKNGVLIGIDRDSEAIEFSKSRLQGECKKIFVNDVYENYPQILQSCNLDKVDGILIDLGVSSYQIDNPERGFSYMSDGKLDMRMDKNQEFSAYDVVNDYSEKELIEIFFKFGEEQFSRSIAKNIIKSREIKKIETTKELVKIIEGSVPGKILYKGSNVSRKVFQAIRIEVNGELINLEKTLKSMIDSLKFGGRICVITFHSLEDRIVKNIFNLEATDCICPKNLPVCICKHKARLKLITKKPLVPTEEEQLENKRSGSSKLRIAEKL